MIERIEYKEQLFAIIVPASYRDNGIHFFTPDDFSQQLAYMRRPTGHLIEPHSHNPVPREVVYTQEVLFIRSGRLRVDFYDDERNWIESRELGPGDVILLAAGGHGFEVLDEAEIIEVKQGPYAGDRDKTRFQGKVPGSGG
ncbi:MULTISPECIES: hypothetical protein [unclassified Thiocapsa]|uniref:hypothetical protein n=1 Tax=unclassified Thiocapsa TaxID=2641286 RepID=UPI0035B20F8E